jgi:glycosyltransferase involved in cell wall biosynthesis
MFGIGPLKSSLIRFVEEHRLEDCVVVNDGIHAAELVGELSRSAYLVIPSRIESIPVIFSDALQAGLPVIALPVGDLPLLISESDCGILATDCSPEALARAIEVACDCCQKERYAENAYKLAREFRIDATAKKWVQADDV